LTVAVTPGKRLDAINVHVMDAPSYAAIRTLEDEAV
jgi:hypothetical protein